jgi:hypothetical protein
MPNIILSAPPLPTNLPNVARQLRGPSLSLNTPNSFALQESYSDFQENYPQSADNFDSWFNGGNNAGDMSQPKHFSYGEAMQKLGCSTYARHIKPHAFKRFPACVQGDNFYSHSLYYLSNCHETAYLGPSSRAWLDEIIYDGRSLDLITGGYNQAMADFFYQMESETGNVDGGLNLLSTCLCRTKRVDNYEEVLPVSEALANSNNVNAYPDNSYQNEIETYGTGNPDNPDKAAYYLCVNCINWRQLLAARLERIRLARADYLQFDVDHMPERGCFCVNCRQKFADWYCSCNPDCEANAPNGTVGYNTNNTNYLHGYVRASGLNTNTPISENYPKEMRRFMQDFMNRSLIEHFEDLQNTMHGSAGAHSTMAVVSTGELPGLIDDSHRIAFARSVDMPKAEWTMPLKRVNNSVFFKLPTDQHTPLLGSSKIPEATRLMFAFNLYRDVSKYRLPHIWIANEWRPLVYDLEISNTQTSCCTDPNETAAILERNNKILTWIGLGHVIGARNSTSTGNFHNVNGNVIKYDWWSFTPNLTIQGVNLSSATSEVLTPAFEYEAKVSTLLQNKRPYRWAAIHYSEDQRNDQLYSLDFVDDRVTVEAEKQVWLRTLIPLHFAYQALSNQQFDLITTQPNTSEHYINRKVPVGFIFDKDEVPHQTSVVLEVDLPNDDPIVNITGVGVVKLDPDNDDFKYYGTNNSTLFFQEKQHEIVSQSYDNALDTPPFFIMGKSPASFNVQANFFTGALKGAHQLFKPQPGDMTDVVVVPLVNKPVWSIPRISWREYGVKIVNSVLFINTFQVQIGSGGNMQGHVGDDLFYSYNPPQLTLWNADDTETVSLVEGEDKSIQLFRRGTFDPAFESTYNEPLVPISDNELHLFVKESLFICGGTPQVKMHVAAPGLPEHSLQIQQAPSPYPGYFWWKLKGFTTTSAVEVRNIISTNCEFEEDPQPPVGVGK